MSLLQFTLQAEEFLIEHGMTIIGGIVFYFLKNTKLIQKIDKKRD